MLNRVAPSRRTPRAVALRLFVTCWVVYALHFATNTVREIYPALSLGDHWSFDVSEYVGFHPDIFIVPGRGAFINNNPGASILAAIPYALARPAIDRIVQRVQRQRTAHPRPQPPAYDSPWPMAREFYGKARARGLDIKFGLGAWVMQAFLMAPLSALSAVVMFGILLSLTASVRAACLLALLYAFGTPIFYRTAQLNQNLLVGDCAFFAFALLWRPWDDPRALRRPHYFLAGLLCGWAVVCDYSGLVVVLVLSVYGLVRRRALPPAARACDDVWRFGGGVLLGAVVLMAYQWSSFGHPLYPAQLYMPPARFTHLGYAGMEWPQPDLLWATAFDLRFGLFTSAPLLLLALYPPAWLAGRIRLTARRETWCIGIFGAVFFLFCAANQYGRLQFNSGVRHVVPVTPFIFLIAAGVLVRLPKVLALVVGLVTAYWSWCLAMCRDVERGRGVVEALSHITLTGPHLPWLTTLERMGYVSSGTFEVPVLALTAILLWVLWRGGAGRGVPRGLRLRWWRLGCIAAGLALVAAAGLMSSGGIERALLRDPSRSLAWGPALFRVLLAGHGLAAVLAGLAWGATRDPAPPDRIQTEHRAAVPWLTLAVLSIVALGLRLWHLGSDLWFDEVLTLLNFARAPLGTIVTSFPSQNQHMFYSVLAHGSIRLFGESAWALRLPSVLFGVGSVWALFLLGRRLIGRREALLACALLTVSYHHIWFSQNARGYMGLMFFATLATWLWIEAQQRSGWRWWMGYVAAVALGMWTHLTMAFVWAAQVLLSLLPLRRTRRAADRGEGGWFPRLVIVSLLCGSVTLQLYALALPEFLHKALHEVSLRSEWTNPVWVIGESLRSLRMGFAGTAAVLSGGAFAAVGWLSILRRDVRAALALVLPAILGGVSMLMLGHNLWPRFFFFSMGFAVLMVIQGAMTAPRLVLAPMADGRLRRRWAAGAGVGLACMMIVASAITVPRCYALPKQDFTGARDYVERVRKPGDGIVAVGLAGVAYGRYYAPYWAVAQTRPELDAVRQRHAAVWLVYTLPIQVKAYRPDIWKVIDKEFEIVKVFPGTLGGGAVYVCRQRRDAGGATGFSPPHTAGDGAVR
ncbi:MAG: glycosyltransferase family 39 protein [Candidatus Binatia bacterium]